MSVTALHQILELTDQLTPEERLEVVQYLLNKSPRTFSGTVTRETLMAEHERLLAAGAFEGVESLLGKYDNPAVDISAKELDSYLHTIGTEWEAEIDDLNADD